MQPRYRLLTIAAFATLALEGCVPQGGYPSLSQRPFEHAGAQPSTPVSTDVAPVSSADPALVSHLAELERASIAADVAFEKAVPGAARAADAAGASGSESWIAAQQLVSALDTLRASDTAALAELDGAARTLEASTDPRATAGLTAVAAEVAALQVRDDAHLRTVEALGRKLPS